jgi:hypothetical protein
LFSYGLIPNIPENKRNRKSAKRGRKRLFNAAVYKRRFTSERSFAWIDKFRALLIRYDRKDAYFLGAHHIAFALSISGISLPEKFESVLCNTGKRIRKYIKLFTLIYWGPSSTMPNNGDLTQKFHWKNCAVFVKWNCIRVFIGIGRSIFCCQVAN